MAGSMRERRDNVWELRVSVPPENRGDEWTQISRTFHGGKRAAAKTLDRMVNEYVNVRTAKNAKTVRDYLELRWWPSWSKSGKSPSTVQSYRWRLDKIIYPAIGDVPLLQLTALHLDTMYQAMTAAGQSAASVRRVHAICSKAFGQAVKWNLLYDNPAKKASPPVVTRTEMPVPTEAEVSALIRVAQAEEEKLMAQVITIAVNTGMRRAEICGLRHSDIDLVTRRVKVQRSITDVAGVPTQEKATKSGKARFVPISAEMAAVITERMADAYELAAFAEVDVTDDPYLFSLDATSAEPLRPGFVTHQFQALAKRVGFGYRFHDLRHFFCTHLMVSGFDPVTVAALAGHSSAKMTLDVYGGTVDARLSAAGEAMRFGGVT